MENSDGPKTINIVFGAPISADGSTMDDVIGKLKEQHPDWTINADVVMHSGDGISPLGRTPGSYQNLNNIGYRDATYSNSSAHGTENITGRDPNTGKIKHQEQADWIKNSLNR